MQRKWLVFDRFWGSSRFSQESESLLFFQSPSLHARNISQSSKIPKHRTNYTFIQQHLRFRTVVEGTFDRSSVDVAPVHASFMAVDVDTFKKIPWVNMTNNNDVQISNNQHDDGWVDWCLRAQNYTNLPIAAWNTWMKIGRPGTSGLMGTRRIDMPWLMSKILLSNFGFAARTETKSTQN